MKKLLLLVMLFSFNAEAQFLKDIFKYSTLYASYDQNNSIQPVKSFYVTQYNSLEETTPRIPNDATYTFGLRKLAFFDYEDKDRFYDGTETNIGQKSNEGNTNGLEYLFEMSKGKQQGDDFRNSKIFLRYLADHYIVKLEQTKNELVDLDYKSADVRFRLPIGKKLSLSIGGIYRTYQKAYGVNPIQSYLEENQWWNLSRDYYGHSDIPYSWENLQTGETGIDYFWYDNQGTLLSNSDLDYRNNIFGQLVNSYNDEQLELISGGYANLSGIVGLDYYHYRKSFWFHAYGSVLPIHKTFAEADKDKYSYESFVGKNDWIDYSVGGQFGFKLNKKLGLFTEVAIQKYWDRKIEVLKAGINFKF